MQIKPHFGKSGILYEGSVSTSRRVRVSSKCLRDVVTNVWESSDYELDRLRFVYIDTSVSVRRLGHIADRWATYQQSRLFRASSWNARRPLGSGGSSAPQRTSSGDRYQCLQRMGDILANLQIPRPHLGLVSRYRWYAGGSDYLYHTFNKFHDARR